MKPNEKSHFSEEEFRSPDMADTPVILDAEFLRKLEYARSIYGKPIHINSGWRSPEHNSSVGGSVGSSHLLQPVVAADLRVVSPKDTYNLLQALIRAGFKRIGISPSSFIHADIDPKKRTAVWTY